MRILRILPVVSLFILVSSVTLNAQCKAFAKADCLPGLAPYTHDGNYHATVLVEGEEAELFKTFYSDMDYRLAVCGEEILPPVEFSVLDANNNLLYTNKSANFAGTWDFRLESSQQLKFIIKVNTASEQGAVPKSGCVAIMFGFKVK